MHEQGTEPADAADEPAPPPLPRAPTPASEQPLATRIEEAQRQAREQRIQRGLPPDADDGGYLDNRPRKHAPKRSKKHGQFLGTVCDSWEATRRRV